jgi:hypothetical protein
MTPQADLIELLYQFASAGLDPVFLSELPGGYLRQMSDQIQREPASTPKMAVTKATALRMIRKHYFGEHDQRDHGNRYGEGEHRVGDRVTVDSPFSDVHGQEGVVQGKHHEHPGMIQVRLAGGRVVQIHHAELNNPNIAGRPNQPYNYQPGPHPRYYGRVAYEKYGWSRPGDHYGHQGPIDAYTRGRIASRLGF